MTVDPDSPLGRLLAGPVRPGELAWIGLRPERKGPMSVVAEVALVAHHGIPGDHYSTDHDGPRQVTLIAEEDLAAIASFIGAPVGPEQMRRNLVTRGVNLVALKDRSFRIGAALLQGSGACEPCGRMEFTLGPGGFNAARGHGGITARILEGGVVRIGDRIERAD